MTAGKDGLYSCVAYVGGNPSKFTESFWEINSFKVYGANSVVSSSSSSKLSSKIPAASTSPLPLTTFSIVNGRGSSGSVPTTTTMKYSSKSMSTSYKVSSSSKASSSSASPNSSASPSSSVSPISSASPILFVSPSSPQAYGSFIAPSPPSTPASLKAYSSSKVL